MLFGSDGPGPLSVAVCVIGEDEWAADAGGELRPADRLYTEGGKREREREHSAFWSRISANQVSAICGISGACCTSHQIQLVKKKGKKSTRAAVQLHAHVVQGFVQWKKKEWATSDSWSRHFVSGHLRFVQQGREAQGSSSLSDPIFIFVQRSPDALYRLASPASCSSTFLPEMERDNETGGREGGSKFCYALLGTGRLVLHVHLKEITRNSGAYTSSLSNWASCVHNLCISVRMIGSCSFCFLRQDYYYTYYIASLLETAGMIGTMYVCVYMRE